jgi:hypothetical protein
MARLPFETSLSRQNLKIQFHNHATIAFCPGQKAENRCEGLLDLWKHRFLNLAKIGFLVFKEVEHFFANPLNPLKNRILDFVQAAF